MAETTNPFAQLASHLESTSEQLSSLITFAQSCPELHESPCFTKIFTAEFVETLKNVYTAKEYAVVESLEWETTKNMTREEKGHYFLEIGRTLGKQGE